MRVLAAAAATLCCLAANVAAQEVYYPGPGDAWESRLPGQVGMDPDGVRAAVDFAMSHEIGWLPDMVEQMTRSLSRQPYRELVGPLKDRVGPSGLIMRHGYIVAEWGDTRRVDMTFSVTKSYLATVAGLALDRGLIRDVHDPVSQYVHDGGFEGHNAPITWHQMLNQTNEWEGELFGIPDVADRREGRDRALNQPGTFWEYNDVRVNRTALSLLRVFGRALP
ncbi:MAG: serine hydrolase, partial [Gemmatimonadales bacterium]